MSEQTTPARVLQHLWISASCRFVRLILGEKRLAHELKVETGRQRGDGREGRDPLADLPILTEPDGTTLTEALVIGEYLDEVYPDPPLIGIDPMSRAEARRLMHWFDRRFALEVGAGLVGERVMKRLLGRGTPNSELVRQSREALRYHLERISFLAETRNWLAGDRLTYADLAAGAQLSVIDYSGDVPWDDYPEAKTWYARLKSRPGFRPLLDDRLPGIPPSAHYADLDF